MRVALNGHVVSDNVGWLYEYFGFNVIYPSKVRQAIEDNPEGEDLVLEINSGGGQVFAGFEIFSVLKGSNVHTVAEVQSIAASAASTIMVGCDTVMLSPVAQVMVHLPSCITAGNEIDHDDSVGMLQSITKSIIASYESKCRGKSSREELEAMVKKQTWLFAEDAVKAGFADGIIGEEGEGGILPQNIMNSVGAGIRAMGNSGLELPDVNALRAEYNRLQNEGKTDPPSDEPPTDEPPGNDPKDNIKDWRVEAKLAIEKMRY